MKRGIGAAARTWHVDRHDGLHLSGLAAQRHDAVGEEHRLVDVMGDEQNGLPRFRLDADEIGLQCLAGRDVERAERLVHQQDRGLDGERARQRNALPLAARKLVRKALRGFAQADARERLLGAGFSLRACQRQLFQSETDVREDAPPRQQPRILEHHRHGAARAWRLRDRHRSVRRPRETHEDAQQRRFADARCADDGEEFAGRDIEIEALQNLRPRIAFAEGDAEVADRNDGRHQAFHASARDCTATKIVSTSP